MDLRTGRMYDSKAEALAAGVPESDLAEILVPEPQADLYANGREALLTALADCPEVRFASGPFAARTYVRTPTGQLVRKR